MEIDDNIFQAIQACWTGKASPEQIELIQDWLDTSQENRDLFERLSKTHYQLAHVQTWKRIDSLQGKEKLNSRLKKQKKGLVADENRYPDSTGSTDGPYQGCGRNSWY